VGELDLEKIDRVAEANKSFGEDLPGYFTPTPTLIRRVYEQVFVESSI